MVRGKGNKPRIVFLSDAAVKRIGAYLAARDDSFDPLFLNHGRGSAKDIALGEKRRLTTYWIEQLVKKYAMLAGIVKKVSPHTLRHCIDGKTRIFTSNGIVSAEQLFTEKIKTVKSMNFKNNKNINNKTVRHFKHNERSLLTIWASGREIICSKRHTFFTITKDKDSIKRKSTIQVSLTPYQLI